MLRIKFCVLSTGAVLLALLPRLAHATIVSLVVPNHSFELGSDPTPDGFNTVEGDFTACEGCRNPGATTTYSGSLATSPIYDWNVRVPGFRFGGRIDPNDSYYAGTTSANLPAPADSDEAAYFHWGAGTGTGPDGLITSTNAIDANPVTAGIQDIEAVDYVLTVAVGNPLGTNRASPTVIRLELLGDGGVIKSSGNIIGSYPADGAWTDLSLTMTAAEALAHVGKELKVQLVANKGSTERRHVNFDNVRLTADIELPEVVPEPGAVVLAGLAGLGLAVSTIVQLSRYRTRNAARSRDLSD